MIQLLDLQKTFLQQHIKPGGIAADFTMGNGHDTLYLANAVGEEGHVFAFDIQDQAIANTRRRLEENGVAQRVTLIHDSHEFASRYISEPICAGVFNLGWLPGSADKTVTTRWRSTQIAVQAAVELLAPDGILLIAVYPGHDEGKHEGEQLEQMLSAFSRFVYCVSTVKIINSPTSPYFIMVERK